AMLAWAMRLLPATPRAYINEQMVKQVEQLLNRAVQHGVNTAAANLRGREISIDVKHEVLEDALTYAIQHGPAKLIVWMGGEEAIREKIEARLPWAVAGTTPLKPPLGAGGE